ncbi:hypothetical protein [Pseudalkalibacillus hwajinpoensis]|uniref:DUF3450 domain-containing protein n=1 Tax=Guptibacillus hwajinpoensis TaxID=208199 RepID=A0A4U1MDN6_9BACL|nr:hypothetical protein [Pseudalkalibacillus hwajinpoensis]TKD68240.1 hypothetical protein FBF83_16990 [Pseudalkalibacillus hwajinpoensis]
MKKLLSTLFALILCFGFGTGALADVHSPNHQKVLEDIEKTNLDINKKIEKAVEDADELQAEYLQDVREIEEGKEIVKLKEEKVKVLKEVNEAGKDEKKREKALEKLEKLNAKMAEETSKLEGKIESIEGELNELTMQLASPEGKDKKKIDKKVAKLREKMNKSRTELEELTNKYTEDLDEIITKVYDETLEMSTKTIAKAAEEGVQAECSWTLVRFAHKSVWIDPIKVVGGY